MTPPRKVKSKKSQGKVRRVRAWIVICSKTNVLKRVYWGVGRVKRFLFDSPVEKLFPCTITYQLPPSGRKKEKRR